MPVNIHYDEMKAWRYIAQLIEKVVLKEQQKLSYDQLVLNTIRSHPVGMSQVDKHVKRFYIETAVVLLEEGYLVSPKR